MAAVLEVQNLRTEFRMRSAALGYWWEIYPVRAEAAHRGRAHDRATMRRVAIVGRHQGRVDTHEFCVWRLSGDGSAMLRFS
ncbi:MAG: hypothetical protein ABSH29_06110 [Acidimicrobiales bacterium]|jgi:hypothetical protein